MDLFVMIFLLGLVLGAAAVASNPSPYFGALGLMVAAGMGGGLLMVVGGSFLSLVLFLIYLGGMLVVFAYTAALSSEEYPQTLGSWPVGIRMFTYLAAVGWSVLIVSGGCGSYFKGGGPSDVAVARVDTSGVAQLYWSGGWILVLTAWVLVLALLVVLELTRGGERGAIRVV
uniref:NADH-ubiquinone oxidoreductase chain 6 n=2 Tax=Trichonotus TaxID=270660 RepID=A0A679EM50_9TELE|nr:NADH dehydrogenase subunit 6 [Trichonotus setiger]BAX03926.1 NADH dehydrogenase subunit 6 [Trichonotus elegans]BBU26056.1 NADH dehydrogenase subunit 6 [Trichonotus elegans]